MLYNNRKGDLENYVNRRQNTKKLLCIGRDTSLKYLTVKKTNLIMPKSEEIYFECFEASSKNT